MSALAAFVAGMAYAFAPYRISSLPHIQVLSSAWMPFVLFGFRRYFDTRGGARWHWRGTAWLLQNLSCGYYLLFFSPVVADLPRLGTDRARLVVESDAPVPSRRWRLRWACSLCRFSCRTWSFVGWDFCRDRSVETQTVLRRRLRLSDDRPESSSLGIGRSGMAEGRGGTLSRALP